MKANKETAILEKQEIGQSGVVNKIPKTLFWILLGAFVIRIMGFIIYLAQGGDGVLIDTPSYVNPAIEFTSSFHFGASAMRTPGYPFLIAICLAGFRDNYYIGLVLFQIVLNTVAVYYVYRLAFLLTKKEKIGYLASLIVALNPMDIMYDFFIHTDSVSQALLVVSIFYFAKYICSLQDKKPLVGQLLAASVILALNVLVRPSLMYLPLALAVGAVVVAIITRCYKQIVISILCICVITQAPVAAWTKRNEIVADYHGYSSISDINLYYYNAVAVYAKQQGMSYYEARNEMLAHQDEGLKPYLETMSEYDAIRKRGWELIRSDLPYYSFCCLKNCGWIAIYPGVMTFEFITDSISDVVSNVKSGGNLVQSLMSCITSQNIVAIVLLGMDLLLLLLLALFAWVGLFRQYRKNWITATLMVGIIAYIYVVSCQPVGIGAYSRFRMACSMFTAILSAQGLDMLISFFRNYKNAKRSQKA